MPSATNQQTIISFVRKDRIVPTIMQALGNLNTADTLEMWADQTSFTRWIDYMAFEVKVRSRGFQSKTTKKMLTTLGITGGEKKQAI